MEKQKNIFSTLMKNELFLIVLGLKLVLSFLFASDFMTKLFIPFVLEFVNNPLSDTYQHFFELGNLNIFPYPYAMLLFFSVPFFLFNAINPTGIGHFDILLSRISLLIADLVIFIILIKLFENKKKLVTIFYWCSPIVIYINYIHGQLDIIPIMFLMASIYYLTKERYLLSSFLLATGLASKSHLLLVIPIIGLYLINKKYSLKKIINYIGVFIGTYVLFLLPFIDSEGFYTLIFKAPEQLRIFDIFAQFPGDLFFYIVPAIYLYLFFKLFLFKKITKDILYMAIGLTFATLVTFVAPMQGWYIWCIPFIVYFFVKEKNMNPLLFFSLNISYLLYFIFVPFSDIFNIFQITSPAIASMQAPYYIIKNLGFNSILIRSLFFTILTSNLVYISYMIFKRSIKNSLIFQEKNGVPIIGIGGDSGSGKTTLSDLLIKVIGKKNVTTLRGDDIHKWERYHQNWKKYTHLNPMSNKIHLQYDQLRVLKSGKKIQRSQYDHNTGKFTKPKTILPRDYIITEGLHTFFINESNTIYDLKIFLDPDESIRRIWKILRDMKKRNYSKKEILKILKKREKDSKKFIEPQRQNSDIIISYKPQNKTNRSDIQNIKVYIQVDVTVSIDINPLIVQLLKETKLDLYMEYPNHLMQRVTFKGEVSSEELYKVFMNLNIDYEEYGFEPKHLLDGFDGVNQLLILYCFNERLKSENNEGYLG